MASFHKDHPSVALSLRVTRHPFSFIGDHDGEALDALTLKREGTWRERLLDYMHGDEARRDAAMAGMRAAGERVGIAFDYSCFINRQPVDSQRMLLYAARHGKQEAYVSALSKRHFENGKRGESASKRHTVLAAAEEAGLELADAEAFFDSDELRGVVWRSYGDMPRRGIHAIPLFVFNVPEIGLEGGPLRPDGQGHRYVVNGSMDEALFEGIFEELWHKIERARAAPGVQGKSASHEAATEKAAEAAEAAAAAAAAQLFLHQRVALCGLVARPALNGQIGRAYKYDRAKGRLAVRLEGGPSAGEVLAVRPANLVTLGPNQGEPPREMRLHAVADGATEAAPNAVMLATGPLPAAAAPVAPAVAAGAAGSEDEDEEEPAMW